MATWRKGSDYHYSYGHNFTVAKVIVGGEPRYEAWFKSGKQSTLLGSFDRNADARACITGAAADAA